MSATASGALIGAALAFAALAFGFWGFLLVAVCTAIGALIGRIASGQIDVRAVIGAFSGRRTS
ncbi:DUF2273 domain-containing protein [Leucobacter japonicus]|uniref:DUF2273 domain-containing protein n=1 Tax=Leucobacter japonicus TaxID=1461259 RepID=UPI0006A78BA6|nr:DUF2273 domain-containing protein [Leucobacter japonicus]